MNRNAILDRLRQALSDAPSPQGVTPSPAGPMAFADAPWEGLQSEWESLGVTVHLARGRDQARDMLAEVVRACAPGPVARWDCPALKDLDLDGLLAEAGVDVAEGDGRYVDAAAKATLGVTGADCLVADTGTVIVLAGPGHERAASLLPPRHLAVITAETTVLPDIPALGPWLTSLSARPEGMPSAAHCITGPSATADIELIRVCGIHGPVDMDVLVVLPD